jgi:hypothetical protein
VQVEGITLRDIPRGWTSRYNECDHLTIDGVKIFSCKVNGDGIDPNGCQDVTIENCLVSTGDDAVVLKSTEGSRRNVAGVTVRGCVLETYPKTTAGEGGDALKIGTETYCPDMRAILFQDCDIIRAHGGKAFSINHRDQARIHDVQFTDIRVEADVENENFGIVMLDSGPGTVSDPNPRVGGESILELRGDRSLGDFRVCAGREPECRLGWRVSCDVGAVMAWSGRCGQGADAGEDLVEQVVSGG